MSRSNPPSTGSPPQTPLPQPWRPRFSLGMMLLVMVVVCVMAAAASYAYRASTFSSTSPLAGQFIFLLIVLAAPTLLMVIVSLLRTLFLWLERRR